MRAVLEKEKPATVQVAGSQKFGNAARNSSTDISGQKDERQDWGKRNPLARWAHRALESAIKRGIVVRPDRCSCCGKVGPVDGHHHDYNRPVDVVWLSRSCHRAEHARLRKAGVQ